MFMPFKIQLVESETPIDRIEADWWWLSFSDETRAVDFQALGVAIVQADSAREAVAESHRLGIYPGGDVLAYCIPVKTLPQTETRNRLMAPDDARELAAAISLKSVH
jgi:hypothetical protein